MSLTVAPLDSCLGARVTGVDLREPMSDAALAELTDAWVAHKVLVLPDQNITDEQHVAFARRFGELEEHHQKIIKDSSLPQIFKVSNVDENNQVRPPASDVMTQLLLTKMWHTDSSFREVPCMGSILRGLEVVSKGGQTCFTNMEAVLEALPADLLAKIVVAEATGELKLRDKPGGGELGQTLPAGTVVAAVDGFVYRSDSSPTPMSWVYVLDAADRGGWTKGKDLKVIEGGKPPARTAREAEAEPEDLAELLGQK